MLSSPAGAVSVPPPLCTIGQPSCSYDPSNGRQSFQFDKPNDVEISFTLDVTERGGLYLFFGVNPGLINGVLDVNIGGPVDLTQSTKRPGDWFLFNVLGTYDVTVQLIGGPGTTLNPYVAFDFLPFGSPYPGNPLVPAVKHLPIVPVGPAPTPLPSTWLLLLGGLIGLGCVGYIGAKRGSAAALAA